LKATRHWIGCVYSLGSYSEKGGGKWNFSKFQEGGGSTGNKKGGMQTDRPRSKPETEREGRF